MTAAAHWPQFEAQYVEIDLLGMKARKFLNLVWAWIMDRTEEKDRESVLFQMEAPLPGEEDRVTEAQAAAEAADFMAAMQMLKPGG